MNKILLLETSHRVGRVGLALNGQVVGERVLAETRRHARDLIPAMQSLMVEQGLLPHDLDAVFVSRGPGSYTGLRVGIMSAKTLAHALGRGLLGIDTFAAIALQTSPAALAIDVWADAQQGKIYAQRFARSGPGQSPVKVEPLAIVPLEDRLKELTPGTWVTGPGLEIYQKLLPAEAKTPPPDRWTPMLASLLALGEERLIRGERDDPFQLEPLYLRPSSAEEKWQVGSNHSAPRPMPK